MPPAASTTLGGSGQTVEEWCHNSQGAPIPPGAACSLYKLTPQETARSPVIGHSIFTGLKLTPGFGEAFDRCGEVRSRVVCPEDEHHHVTKIPNSCNRPECPECNSKWRARAAKGAAQHLKGYEEAYQSKHPARHLILSPPASWMPSGATPGEILQKLYTDTAEILKRYGLSAIVIPHPYRLKDARRADAADRAINSGRNRYQVVLDLPSWEDWIEVEPHSHSLAYGTMPPFNQFYKETGGWVYKFIENKALKRHNYEAVISYLLSHAWVRGNQKVARGYGNLAPARLRCVTTKTKDPRPCKVCGAARVRLHEWERVYEEGRPVGWVYQDLHNAPLAFIVRIEKTYYKPKRRKPPRQEELSSSIRRSSRRAVDPRTKKG